MKVINQLIIALALAVPLSLVTADELVIKKSSYGFKPGTEDYSPDMQEALKISPFGYEQIVVVPPGYDKPAEIGIETVKTGIRLQNLNLADTDEVATKADMLTP